MKVSGNRHRNLFWMVTVIICLGGIAPVLAEPVFAGGTGVDISRNTRSQVWNDAGDRKVKTAIERSKTQVYWEHPFQGKFEEQLYLEQENWAFVADGKSVIDLDFQKIRPTFSMKDFGIDAKAAITVMDIHRAGGIYQPIESDKTDSFTLPSLVGNYRNSKIIYHLGWWKEYDILPLDYLQYTLSLSTVLLYGGGYEISKAQEASLKIQNISRNYPSGFQLDRQDILADYSFFPPEAGSKYPAWKQVNVQWAQRHFPALDDSFQELSAENKFVFKWSGATNFVTHKLTHISAFAVYNQGSVAEAVKEEVIPESDLIQKIDFQAFRWIGKSPLIMAWGLTIDHSLVQQAFLHWDAHLKAVYAY